MASRVYTGRSVTTRRERVVYTCPCGERFGAEVWRAVDARDAEETQRLREGTLNRVRCPACSAEADVQLPILFHDGAAGRLVLILPDAARHRELAERAALWAQLADDDVAPPDYVLAVEVLFGGIAAPRATVESQPIEIGFERSTPVNVLTLEDQAGAIELQEEPRRAPAKEKDLPSLSLLPSLRDEDLTPLPQRAWRGGDSDSHTRVHVNVPDPRAAVTERWIAGRESAAAFLVEDRVLVCASLPPAALEAFIPGHVELRVQLHRLPSYPLLSLTMLAVDPPATNSGSARSRIEDTRLLTVPLDVARAAHRVVLEALGRRCSFALDLFDSQYLPVVAHEIAAPLEENVRRLVAEAKDALDRLAPATRSFERARTQFLSAGYDRLGRTTIELPEENELLDRPGLVRAALSTVVRWSEPNAEAYLVEIRSLPLPRWRQMRARVVRRALDVGIAVSRTLVERSAKEHGAPLPAWAELLELQVKRFTEVAARLKPNDLSATEEADNWELLLRECALAGVAVDDQVRKLAQQSLKRARVGQSGGIDLRTLGTAELVTLLEQKDLRREAAVVLCERRETPTLTAVFGAIRRMTRHEANRVLPAVPKFGQVAERWLLEGLKSKKSFLRQGCALALGALASPQSAEALAQLLVVEPTEIWTEVARALGDAGPLATTALAARLRDVDGEGRERVIEALAQVAARGAAGRTALDSLASGRDALVAAAAQRALGMVGQVRAADREVRAAGGGDSTVVRAFSRRFYEALGGEGSGPVELSAEDVEEIDGEDEDDGDLVTATNIQSLHDRDGESTNPTHKTSLPRGRG
jgi:CpXC protein